MKVGQRQAHSAVKRALLERMAAEDRGVAPGSIGRASRARITGPALPTSNSRGPGLEGHILNFFTQINPKTILIYFLS